MQPSVPSTVASPPNQLENSISAEDRALSLEILRRHNSSLKQLKGQTIGGCIFRTDERFVFLDTGFNKHVEFARTALQASQLISSRDGGVRTSPEDFRVGDVLKCVVEEVETAYGDVQLSTEREVASDEFPARLGHHQAGHARDQARHGQSAQHSTRRILHWHSRRRGLLPILVHSRSHSQAH